MYKFQCCVIHVQIPLAGYAVHIERSIAVAPARWQLGYAEDTKLLLRCMVALNGVAAAYPQHTFTASK